MLDYFSEDYTAMQTQYRSSMMGAQVSIKNRVEVPAEQCTTTACTTISITGSRFSEFNFLKSELLYLPKVSRASKMTSLGVILDLQDYYGRIVFNDNSVSSIQFNFKDWNIRNNQTSSEYSEGTSADDMKVTQMKATIYISMKTAQVEIINSSFEQCNSVSGVIYISKQAQSRAPLLIDSNNFTQNSAFEGANAIKINMTLDVDEGTYSLGSGMI